MKNKVQLIAYADRFGGTLQGLTELLQGPLSGLFGGLHLLPFFHRIDGADAGFDPTDHTVVDARLGAWSDLQALATCLDLMADVIVNHISIASPQFQDFLDRGEGSPFASMFLTLDTVFPQGVNERDLLRIYRPRAGLPFTPMTLKNGIRRILWTTFTPQQVDIDVEAPRSRDYLEGILGRFAQNKIRMVRLDAIGYAVKRAGGSCFMTPQTFDFIAKVAHTARQLGMEVLVEVHSHYRQQLNIAAQVDWVYDFALPPMLLHALYAGTARKLKEWIRIRPTNCLTVLDTHDGIGIIDAGPDGSGEEGEGLLGQEELRELVEKIHAATGGASLKATGSAAQNLDLYQVNSTFYDALGQDDSRYLLARAVQFLLPGVPQVYYVGLLAGANDMDLLERTGVGRDINRHFFTNREIAAGLERPVVKRLLELIRLRNSHPAFDGRFELHESVDEAIDLEWTRGPHFVRLKVNFARRLQSLEYSAGADTHRFPFP